MNKTIKQLADQIGVSKHTILNRIKKNENLRKNHTHNFGNKLLVDDKGQKTLLETFPTSNIEKIEKKSPHFHENTSKIEQKEKKPKNKNLQNDQDNEKSNQNQSIQIVHNLQTQISDLKSELKAEKYQNKKFQDRLFNYFEKQQKQTDKIIQLTDQSHRLQANLQKHNEPLKKLTTKKTKSKNHWWKFW